MLSLKISESNYYVYPLIAYERGSAIRKRVDEALNEVGVSVDISSWNLGLF